MGGDGVKAGGLTSAPRWMAPGHSILSPSFLPVFLISGLNVTFGACIF